MSQLIPDGSASRENSEGNSVQEEQHQEGKDALGKIEEKGEINDSQNEKFDVPPKEQIKDLKENSEQTIIKEEPSNSVKSEESNVSDTAMSEAGGNQGILVDNNQPKIEELSFLTTEREEKQVLLSKHLGSMQRIPSFPESTPSNMYSH